MKELNGKRLGAATASTFEFYLQRDLVIDVEGVPAHVYDVSTDDIASYENSNAGLDDLRLGDGVRIDGMIGSLPAFQDAIEANYPIRIIGTPAFYEPLSVAIDRGDQEFNDKLAGLIKAMHEDGTLSKLSHKWYGIDYTKKSDAGS
jgi:polar amino acid transport system substrate-binding protein